MQKKKRLSSKYDNTKQPIYHEIVKQPLAPMVLRVGLINFITGAKDDLIHAAIAPTLADISKAISDLAKLPTAKHIYNSEKPILRLVSGHDLVEPKSELLKVEYFKLRFDSTIQETSEEDFEAKQVAAHSDVILIVTDDSIGCDESIIKRFSDQSKFENVPMLIQVKHTVSELGPAKASLLRSPCEKLSDSLSEILLFDSLLNALPADNELSEAKLKSHTLKRIADFVAEDSLEVNQEQPDFDYQGPIKAKGSLLSWRNVFTRFINFLSPIGRQPSLKTQNNQSDLDEMDENLSAMQSSKSCQYLYALFMRSDQLAIKYANAHRSSFILIYCLGAFALINAAIAIGFSEIGWLALTSALAEFFALVAIFVIYRNDHKNRYHIKWLEYRSLAEILRVSPHLNSVGMVFTTQGLDRHRSKENESNLSAHSVGRTWLIVYSETIKRWLDCNDLNITQQTLMQGKAFLTEKLIAGQVNYHYKNAHRMHYAGHSLGKFSFVLFVFAFVFVSGKLVTKLLSGMALGLDPGKLHHIGHYLGFLAAICPMLGSAAFAIRNHAEFDISSQRSQTMLKKLDQQLEIFQQLVHPIPYKKLHDTCQETALIMQSETADWLEIYEVKETEPA